VTFTVTDDDGGTGNHTISVEVGTPEDIIEYLIEYIQDLPDDDFDGPVGQRKNALSNSLSAVEKMLLSNDLKEAVDKLLSDIRQKADGSMGGHAKNDWIVDPVSGEHICVVIDDLIAYLETLME
jgi:hypothetical protein